MIKYTLGILLCLFAGIALSQNNEKRCYQTAFITEAPVIDGKLNDDCWNQVEWSGNFTQQIPYENQAPSQQTYFKILYDNNNLYVFLKASDTEMDKINPILTRHDNFAGDRIEIIIDSNLDKQTAFAFTAMASGSKGDEAVSLNGNNWDVNWNPVWQLKTSIKSDAWYAEVKIPFSELRFGNKEEHVWGLQVRRNLYRKTEYSLWQYIPKGSPGEIHLYGELHGIENIKPKRQFELSPYLLSKFETFEKEQGNPFRTGKKSSLSFGLNGKLGISNNFTLDFSINPDFGQVEADPSEVNLTAFESYFPEKRPFFIEGRNIYEFKPSNPIVSNNLNRDLLFYSRRLGRKPQHFVSLEDNEYADVPEVVKILAAVKLSGKTKNGLSVGIMESVTANEKATIDNEGEQRKESVEPLTNYLVASLQKDFNKGKTVLGGMFTSVNRDITNPDMNYLHKAAYTGGIDFQHNWAERTWYVGAKGVFSSVQGDRSALIATQQSSARYFQRPDASHVSLDSSITALSGYGGSFVFGRRGQKKLRFQTSVSFRSPGLEFNDIGYMSFSDIIHHGTWVGYQIREPFSIFRNFYLNLSYWTYFNFSGTNLSNAANINFNTRFKNMWRIGALLKRQSKNISTKLLRGGPSVKQPGVTNFRFTLGSNGAKKLSFYSGNYNSVGDENSFRYHSIWGGVTFRPLNSLSFTLSSAYWVKKNNLQYISTIDFENQKRYVLGKMNQETANLTFRINYTITPTLSVQYYGRPFISKGRYNQFKYMTNPSAENYNDRFHIYNNSEIVYNIDNDQYDINENQDGMQDYTISNPDFNFRQFRSNLVFRWEYLPGSILYFVWSQEKNYNELDIPQNYGDDLQNLFDAYPHNVFLIKLTYRIAL